MSSEAVYVGLDVGAQKTSVTSSIGQRAVVTSVVGWGEVRSSEAAFDREVVFGEQAVAGESALDLVRPFAGGWLNSSDSTFAGLSHDEQPHHCEAARLLIAHAVSLVSPPAAAMFGVLSVASRATLQEKMALLEACRGTFDAAMVVSTPFAVAYGLDHLHDTIVVDLGAETTGLCPMLGLYPKQEDLISLPLGGDTVDKRFIEEVAKRHPDIRLTSRVAREIKEKFGHIGHSHRRVEVTSPSTMGAKEVDLTEPLNLACNSIVEPIVEGIMESLAKFDPRIQQSLLDNILLAGGGSRLNGLDGLIEEGLAPNARGHVSCVYDRVFSGADGALRLATDMPDDRWAVLRQMDRMRSAA